MARIKKTARECRGDDSCCTVGLKKHATGVLQPDALDERHWGAVARVSERLEYAAGARAGSGREGLDRDRAIPIGSDVFLAKADLPGCRTLLLPHEKVAEIMRVGGQEGDEQHLLEFDKSRGRHLGVVTVEFAHHEFEHAPHAPKRRVVKARAVSEFDVSGDRSSDRGAQLGLQRRSLDPENKRFEARLLFVCHLDPRRDDTRFTLIDIELPTAKCRPARVVQGELLFDDRHARKANPIRCRASAKKEIDTLEPDVTPVNLEEPRLGPNVEPRRPEIPDKHLVEFVGTLRVDERKLMQRPQIGSTEHFRGSLPGSDTRATFLAR